ncbi:MAG: GxxExxY protein [Candidatus Euphemobacter frigidus]|nr:GxxExxY protein [Candidatus Euphemobacter frigidus]MDP8275585.1 GxxExxY protein [Candidatus Euphemobacter frigidus]
MEENNLSSEIIGAAIEVHKLLGPGLLESAYQAALARELVLRNILFEKEKALPLIYKGVKLDCGFRLDILVGGLVVVELKAVEKILPIHEAQVLTYLKLLNLKLGLILNFNVPVLKEGIKRLVYKL